MKPILMLPLTENIVQMAVGFIYPVLARGAQTGVFKRESVYVYVMNPLKRYGECDFQDAVLWEGAIGNPDVAENYKKTAKRKARRAWRVGVSGSEIQSKYPFLYKEGDTKWHGDFVELGLVVATSGIQGHFDELISTLIGKMIIYLCRDIVIENVMPAEDDVFV